MEKLKAANVSINAPGGIEVEAEVLKEKTSEEPSKCEGLNMENIASLLALMQSNKGMDIPGLLALCKDKGYDKGWGGEGMFMFVFLMLFMFAGGGWGNFGNRDRGDFSKLAGENLTDMIGIYDRFGQTNQSISEGFRAVDTHLCQSIEAAITATRNQGDRIYDAVRNGTDAVGAAVKECCCNMRTAIAETNCNIDKLRGEVNTNAERTINHIDRRTCELEHQLATLKGAMEVGFEKNACLVTNTALQQERDRQAREISELKDRLNTQNIATIATANMQNWMMNNYTPTAWSKSGGGAAGGATA